MDANSDHGYQPHQEEPPSSEPLGLQHPLLPPPVLGQPFLQPHTLSPLGAVSLINLDTSLMPATARGDFLHTNFSAQEPTEIIDGSPSSHSHMSQAVETQFPTTAQPRSLAPKASVEMLQPQLEQVPTHREQPKVSNNVDSIPSNAPHAPKVDPSSSFEMNSVLDDDKTLAAAPSIQPTSQHQVSSQPSVPYARQAESVKQFDQDQSSPNEVLRSKLAQAPELGPPSDESHSQGSAPAPSQTENTPELQTSSEVISEQTVVEPKQQPEQATQQPIAHPSSEAVATEASTSTPSPDVPPLQTKFQDLQDTNATPEAPASQESLPHLANLTNSTFSSTQNSDTFTQTQPSLQKAPSSNDNFVTPSTERDQVAQKKEESPLKTPSLSKQNPVASFEPSQEQQASDVQPTESLPVSSQTSRDIPTQDNRDITPTSPAQKTSTTTDNPNNQIIESSTNSSVNLQTNNPQSSSPNLKVVANPSNTTDESSLHENSVKPSSATKTTKRPTKTITVQRAKEPSAQQVPTDQPSSPAKAATSSSAPKTNERPTEATTLQKTEKSSAQQIPTDQPHTPEVETNQTRPTDEPSSVKNVPTPSSPPKNNEEPISTTTNQRSDDLSAQTSNKVSAKKQKKQSKKSKRKKIPLKAQLLRMTERAKQDINKVGIHLKQASHSLPIGKSRTQAQGLQGATSDSPQTQTAGVPSIQARSSSDSKQSSPEISSDLREIKTVEQVSSPQPSIKKQHQEKTEIPNQRENSQTVHSASDSEDSSIQNPLQTPVQTKSLTNSEPTINHDSITSVNKVTEPISESKAIGQPQIESKSLEPEADTLNQNQQKNTSSPDVTFSEESSSSQFKPKKRRQFPKQPLKRLSSISKQVLDTVSRQLEPHPNEQSIPLQQQKQTQSSKSEQISEDQRSSAISSPRTVAEGTQPALDSSTGDSDNIAVASAYPGIQAKSSAPGTAFSSKSSSNSSEQGNQEGLVDLPAQGTAKEKLQTKELPTIQAAAESNSGEPASPHPQLEDSSASNTTKESSELEGHSPASLSETISKPKSAKPRWQTIQTQVAEGITTLGSQIKERVDRSIRKQSSSGRSPQSPQINETGLVKPARSSEAAPSNTLLQSSDVSEPNGNNIQASAEPNSDKAKDNEQPLLNDPVQLTSTSNSATRSLVQTDTGAIVTPSQEEDIKNPDELTTDPSIQPSSIDEAKTSKLHQNSEQSDTALLSGNEDTIQRSQASSEIPSVSSDHQTINVSDISSDTPNTAIPESPQTRDRNLPISTHISKIGASIVQQLANLRPKKTKSKRKTKKQKPASSPTQIPSENPATDTSLSPASIAGQDKTPQPSGQQLPTVQEQASTSAENKATVRKQHDTGESVDLDPMQDAMTSDHLSSIETPAIDHSSIKVMNLESEILSPSATSSVDPNSSTTDIIQQQPITAEEASSKLSDLESSSPSRDPNLQQKTEQPSLSSDTVQLSPQEDYLAQGEYTQQAASTTTNRSATESVQRQTITNQQSSLINSPDDPIKHSEVSTLSSSCPLPQTELPLQESQDSKEDLGTSDTTTSIADPVDQDSLLQLQTTQKQSPPDLPDSHTQNLLGQNALGIGSNPPERSPINEASIQTKVEQPFSNKPIQPQQQLPASSNPSVQQFSTKDVQFSSESRQSAIREESDVDKKGGIPETGFRTSLEQNFSQKLDNTSNPSTQASSQNLDSIHTRASTSGEPEYSVQDDTSPTVQAKEDPTVGIVPEQAFFPATSDSEVTSPNAENTAVASPQTPDSLESASTPPENSEPQAPSNGIATSENITETNGSIQRKIEVISDSDQPFVKAPSSDANIQNEQVDTQPTDTATSVQENISAKSEPASEISSLAEKKASTVPIQAVEVSLVQPKAELQPQNVGSTQLFDDSDRTQESTSNTGDKLSTQLTPESKLPHPIDQTIRQQATPNVSPQTSATADTAVSIDLPEAAIESDIQASTIEQSYPPNTASADVSEESEITQSEHQPNIVSETTIDLQLPTSTAINSDQATPVSSTDPVISDTNTSDLQNQLAAENLADSPSQISDSIQPQLDNLDSPHHRVIEIAAQRPDQNIGNVNLPTQDISSSLSSDTNEHQLLQRNLESNSSLVEVDLDSSPSSAELSSDIVERSDAAELPEAKTDSNIQIQNTDNSGSTIPSIESLSSPLNKSTIQRQTQAGDTLDSLPPEKEQVHTQSDSTDSLQRQVIKITAQPPESGTSEDSSPDLTVAQLLANGQAPPPLSNISDNLVSPKHLGSLLPHSKPSRKYQSQKLSGLQSINVSSDLVSSAGEAAGFEDNYGSGAEGAIAPSIQRSSSHSDQTLPSSWSSIEDLFTAQPQSPKVVQRQATSPASETTSDFVLTPTGIYPEKLVQRKTAPVRRTTQTLQKTSATPPQVSSPPQTTEVVMRQSQTDNSTESEIDEQSFEILAREIYHVLRQRLEVERERHGGYHSGRLPW